MRIAALVILFLVLLPVSSSGQGDLYERLAAEIEKFGQAEVSFRIEGNAPSYDMNTHLSISNITDREIFAVINNRSLEYFTTLNLPFKLFERTNTKALTSAASVADAMNWDKYPTYQQYDSIMVKLANDNPLYCKLDTIGYSVRGRLLLALKISDNVTVDENEPEVFYSSSMHGDELAGYVLLLHFADYLLKNAQGGGREQALVDSLEIWINPLANPDGTYRFGDTITSPTRANYDGFDLNRGFPDPTTSPSTIPLENQYTMQFFRNRGFVLSANFHSGIELLNFPWDKDWGVGKTHPDSTWFNLICREYADTVHHYSSIGYMDDMNNGVTRGDAWYTAYGSRQDWVTYETGGREVTIEIHSIKLTDVTTLQVLWDYNYRSLMGYLENAMYGIHGRVYDQDSGLPVKSKIFITGHDADSSWVFSDPQTGSFERMLFPGIYELVISAPGYLTKTLNSVTVSDKVQLRLNVALQPIIHNINGLTAKRPALWPVPAQDLVNVRLNGLPSGEILYTIMSVSGVSIAEGKLDYSENEQVTIPVRDLSAGIYIVSFKNKSSHQILTGKIIKR